MTKETYSQNLATAHRSYIANPTVTAAFDYLVAGSLALGGFRFYPSWHGAIRTFEYDDVAAENRPFAFIVNKGHLTFYVRRPALTSGRMAMSNIGQAFPKATETAGGELKILVRETGDAERILRLLGRYRPKVASEHSVKPVFSIVDHQPKKKRLAMDSIIQRPAALVRQGQLRLYATSLRAKDLLMPGFYDIERLDPANSHDQGYQRVLNVSRAKRLGDYLIAGEETQDAFLPTSVFLATDKELDFDASLNLLTIDLSRVGSFSVVDGQHRLEGLKIAVEKCPDLASFEVPVNIAVGLSKIAQMCHFLIVNTGVAPLVWTDCRVG